MVNHLELHEDHQMRLKELRDKQKLLEKQARENQKNYKKNVRDTTIQRRRSQGGNTADQQEVEENSQNMDEVF